LYVPGVEDKPKYNKENSVIYFGDKFDFKLRYIELGVKEV
jgi:hypothetical protein